MIVFYLILFIYGLFILWTIWGFSAMPESVNPVNPEQQTGFSIIIPFRDEAENLDRLMQSLSQLNYPDNLFEIIMVNDYSTDHSVAVIEKYKLPNFSIINNKIRSGSPKKDALELGIGLAKHEWIITTDADCEVPVDWLKNYNTGSQMLHTKMLLAPVQYFDSRDFLSQFQQIEFLSLQAISIAGVYWKKAFLSNGANMGFEKKAFIQVSGYEGNNQIASGDDVFLLEKFQEKYPDGIAFIKNKSATVKTQAQKNFKSLVQQKIRWGSKTKYYRSIYPKILGLLLFIVNLEILIASLVCIINIDFVYLISAKILLDIWLFFTVNRFYKTRVNLVNLFVSALIYPFYFIYIGIRSIMGDYQWKSRKYTKI